MSAATESTTVDVDGRRAGDPGAVVGGLVALAVTAAGLMVLTSQIIPPVVVFVVAFVALAVGLRRSAKPALRWAAVVLPTLLVLPTSPTR